MKIFSISLPLYQAKQIEHWQKKKGWFGHGTRGWSSVVIWLCSSHGHIFVPFDPTGTLHIDQLILSRHEDRNMSWLACQHTGTHLVKYWLSWHHNRNISVLTGCGSAVQTLACWWPDVTQSTSLYPDGCRTAMTWPCTSESGHVDTSLLCGLHLVLREKHLQME